MEVCVLRIIAGTKRGLKLTEFEGEGIRPTADRVKESMFNLISEYIYGAEVLDLFAGSGALSLEALSRGANNAVLIDKSGKSVKVIKENIAKAGFGNMTDVKNIDAAEYILSCKKQFDIIFLDPPYNKGFIPMVINTVIENDCLSEKGIIVTETDFSEEKYDFESIECIKRRKYGRTFITVYIKNQRRMAE